MAPANPFSNQQRALKKGNTSELCVRWRSGTQSRPPCLFQFSVLTSFNFLSHCLLVFTLEPLFIKTLYHWPLKTQRVGFRDIFQWCCTLQPTNHASRVGLSTACEKYCITCSNMKWALLKANILRISQVDTISWDLIEMYETDFRQYLLV